MPPLTRASLGTVLLAVVGSFGGRGPVVRVLGGPRLVARRSVSPAAMCPPTTLPDGNSCVSFAQGVADDDDGAERTTQANWHHEHDGSVRTYEQIPRSPDRPADYQGYRYPLAPPTKGAFLLSGYDLDQPDERQRRGARLRAVGHGGLDLMAPRGTPLHAVILDHQEGDARVAFVGSLFGTSVVTRHALREGGRIHSYLVLLGHLDGAAPGLIEGAPVREGDLLGFVGDSGSRGLVHLHLEVRRVRDEDEERALLPGELTTPRHTIVVDPRNVFPRRLETP